MPFDKTDLSHNAPLAGEKDNGLCGENDSAEDAGEDLPDSGTPDDGRSDDEETKQAKKQEIQLSNISESGSITTHHDDITIHSLSLPDKSRGITCCRIKPKPPNTSM